MLPDCMTIFIIAVYLKCHTLHAQLSEVKLSTTGGDFWKLSMQSVYDILSKAIINIVMQPASVGIIILKFEPSVFLCPKIRSCFPCYT